MYRIVTLRENHLNLKNELTSGQQYAHNLKQEFQKAFASKFKVMPLLEPALSHLLELEILRQSSLLVCLGILSLVIYRWRNAQTPKVPVVGSPGTLDFRAAMREGLSKVR
jgi:hypothetical protein